MSKILARIDEHLYEAKPPIKKNGDKVRVPHKGKMVDGKVVRYVPQKGAQTAYYVVYVGETASIEVPVHKIEEQLNEVLAKHIDFRILNVGRESLIKIFVGVYDGTSVKELQQAEKKLFKVQAAMVKTIEGEKFPTTADKIGWMSPAESHGDIHVPTNMVLAVYIRVKNTEGLETSNKLYTLLHKHRT